MSFELEVPASIANIGPGFDTLAVAVQLYLRLRVEVLSGEGLVDFHFGGAPPDGENYIERAFLFLANQRGGSPLPSIRVHVESDIPQKSGLGSSAAATVAGLRLYESIAGPLSPGGLLNAACALEHHPDNVAAALLGGMTLSCQLPDRSVVASRLPWPPDLQFVVVTPEYPLSTAESRLALPHLVSREDAVFNLQRVAMLLTSISSGNFALLGEALQDRLHQPYRQKLVPGLQQALTLQHPGLLGTCLCGAGPSVAAFAAGNGQEIEELLAESFRNCGVRFTIRHLAVHQ